VYFYPEDGTRLVRAGRLDFEEVAGMIRVKTEYGSALLHPRTVTGEGAFR
jgi:hypothetical protein